MANANVPLEIRQKLTGHASQDMNKHYTHLELETVRRAVESCQFGNYLRVTEGYLRMKAMETRLRARRAPFGLPAEGKSRFVGHSEHWFCNQRRLSIRFAKEGRRRGNPQSHRRPQPFENHNRPTFLIRK